MRESSVSIGDIIEVTAERLAYGGDAVAHIGGLTIFIRLAAPGDRLRVRVTEKKKRFARAEIQEVIAPSPVRRPPPCRHYGECGGCQLQHLEYDEQLAAKAQFVRDALARIGQIEWPHIIEVRHAAEFGYRSRAQIKTEEINSDNEQELRIGFRRAGSHRVCDVEDCPVLVPELNTSLAALRQALKGGRVAAEIEMAAGDRAVSFNPRLPGLPWGALSRRVLGLDYAFGAETFFQGNALLLDELVGEAIGSRTGRFALDLYSGVGLFALQLSRLYGRVIGIESDRQAAMLARKNVSANDASRVEIYNSQVEQWIKNFAAGRKDGSAPDLILLDPPRTGAAEAIESLAAIRPARITYVSCDPVTLARDLRKLVAEGYGLTTITAFDLFPQTYHVETVAKLDLR
jgi:23S rRNA (uracil1939-C5)-methyltransferase